MTLTERVSYLEKELRKLRSKSEPRNNPEWISKEAAAKILRCETETLRYKYRIGEIQNRKTNHKGRNPMYLKSEIEKLANSIS